MSTPEKPFSESGSSPPVRVLVTSVSVVPGCPVALGLGTDKAGRAIPFEGDWRAMSKIAGYLEVGLRVEAYLLGGRLLAWISSR